MMGACRTPPPASRAGTPFATASECSTPPSNSSGATGRRSRWPRSPSTQELGVGTLYRHFPTREDLLGALVHRSFGLALDPAYAPAPPSVSVTNSRPWLIGLSAMATMLVLFLAIDNAAVSDKVVRHSLDSNGFFTRALVALTTFRWDLGRLSPDPGHLYLGQLLADLAVLVLVLLLVAAVTKGRGTFGQIFFGTWAATVTAGMIGTYVRPMVVSNEPSVPGANDRPTTIFFSVYSPGAATLFASALFGLAVALVAGLVGVDASGRGDQRARHTSPGRRARAHRHGRPARALERAARRARADREPVAVVEGHRRRPHHATAAGRVAGEALVGR